MVSTFNLTQTELNYAYVHFAMAGKLFKNLIKAWHSLCKEITLSHHLKILLKQSDSFIKLASYPMWAK